MQQSNRSNALTLALFVFWVDANYPHHALAVDNLALVTHFLNRSTDFHFRTTLKLLSHTLRLLFIAVSYSSAFQIVGRQFHQDPITGKDANEVFAHLSRNVRKNLMLATFQFDAKHCVRQSLPGLWP